MSSFSEASFSARETVYATDERGGATWREVWRHYDLLAPVGRGAFGVVCVARVRETGELVAVKKVPLDHCGVNREVLVLRDALGPAPGAGGSPATLPGAAPALLLQHPGIAHLRAHYTVVERDSGESFLYLVMDYLPCTVHAVKRTWHKQQLAAAGCCHHPPRRCRPGARPVPPATPADARPFPLSWTRAILFQVARALAFMHARDVAHRDLKPANVLVDPGSGRVRLCDFGSAKQIRDAAAETNAAYVCSRYYRAPELLFGARHYGTAVDLWSLGCLAAELLRRGGEPLVAGTSTVDQMAEIFKLRGTPSAGELRDMCPPAAAALLGAAAADGAGGCIGGLGAVAPADLRRVFPPETPAAAVDLVEALLQYRPGKRLPAAQVVQHPFFDPLFVRPDGAAGGAAAATHDSLCEPPCRLPPLPMADAPNLPSDAYGGHGDGIFAARAGADEWEEGLPLPADMFIPVQEELRLYSHAFLRRMKETADFLSRDG